MFEIDIIGTSKWTLSDWGSGSVGAAIGAAGGSFKLHSPDGSTSRLSYGGIGAGVMAGVKLPKLGKIKLRGTGTVSHSSFPSAGVVLKTDKCSGELARDDFSGICIFGEAGGGLIAGGSAAVLLLGIPYLGSLAFASPVFLPLLLRGVKAVIPLAGLNVGIQAGAGAAVYIGISH